ncbi:polyketide synthase ligase [Streptomyces sp. CB03238]|nr:polyketide synthase ligase [Streptomyces sp. CB03238]
MSPPSPLSMDATRSGLAELGLPPGSAVILCLSNSVHMVQVYLASLLLGLVPLALPPATPSARVRGIAQRLRARAVVTTRTEPERYGSRRARPVGRGTQAVLLDGDGPSPYSAGDVLMPTSGTSGMFSACLHRLDSLLLNARRHAASVDMTASDVVLVSLPLHYSYAMVAQVLAAYVRGARLVVSGPPFSPVSYAAAVSGHAVTHSSITPTLVRQVLASLDSLPPHLRTLTVGGDQLGTRDVEALLRLRAGGELYLTYGLTEAGPRVSTLAAHAEPPRRHASVGLPLPGVRPRLRTPVDADGSGELLIASDTALIDHVGDTDDGRRRGLVRPGVIATGDVFRIDEDGYLYFQGRLSDFVVVRGEKVSLRTLRQVAHTIPGVVHCDPRLAVDDDGSTVLDVHITATDTGRETERHIRRALNSMLLLAERPRAIHVHAADPTAFRK